MLAVLKCVLRPVKFDDQGKFLQFVNLLQTLHLIIIAYHSERVNYYKQSCLSPYALQRLMSSTDS
jgi:hypothetical protein